jgi:hypothetical protein
MTKRNPRQGGIWGFAPLQRRDEMSNKIIAGANGY